MRARSLKPGLFKNELLGKADPLITILFEGLWCSADRDGRLEDRPLRLCGEIFPYRRTVTERKIDTWLTWLHEHGFIVRYMVDKTAFIQIVTFDRHQTPHVKEKPSIIPQLRSVSHGASTDLGSNSAQGSDEKRQLPARSDSGLLTPDSGLLTPDSGLLTPGIPHSSAPPPPVNGRTLAEAMPDKLRREAWGRCMTVYPPYSGRKHWIMAENAASQLVDSGATTWTAIQARTQQYAAYCVATQRPVMRPENFFTTANDPPCMQDWPIPGEESRQDFIGELTDEDFADGPH